MGLKMLHIILLTFLILFLYTPAYAGENGENKEETIIKKGEIKGFYLNSHMLNKEKKGDRISSYHEVWRSMPFYHFKRMEKTYSKQGKLHLLQVYKIFIGFETYTSPKTAKERFEYLVKEPPPGNRKAQWKKKSYKEKMIGDETFHKVLDNKIPDNKGLIILKKNKIIEIYTYGKVDGNFLDTEFIENIAKKVMGGISQ